MKRIKRFLNIFVVAIITFSIGIIGAKAENVAHYFDVFKCPVNSNDYEYEAESCIAMYNNGTLESYRIPNNGNLSLYGDAEGNYSNIILVVGYINVRSNSIFSFNTTWNWDPDVLSIIPTDNIDVYEDEHIYDYDPYAFPYSGSGSRRIPRWSSTVNFKRFSSEGRGIFLSINSANSAQYNINQSTVPNGIVPYFREIYVVNPNAEVGTYTNIIMNTSDIQYAEASTIDLQAVYYDVTNFRLKIYGNEENDATLGGLEVYESEPTEGTEIPYTMAPTFEAGQTATNEYSVIVPNDITSVYVKGTPNSIHYKDYDGLNMTYSNLAIGTNEIPIVITAANGDTFTYTLTIYRLSNDATLKSLSLTDTDIEFNETIDLDNTLNYTATVPYRIGNTTINAETNYNEAYIGMDETVNSIEEEWIIDDNVLGSTTSRNVRVYSESCKFDYIDLNGNTSEDCESNLYTITITREPASTDSTLGSIHVYADGVDKSLTQRTYNNSGVIYDLYEVYDNIANAITSVTIDATANDPYAHVTSGNGVNDIAVGDNYIPFVITAEDGSTTTYYVFVHRLNNDATLSAINVTSNPVGVFTPNFDPNYNDFYTYTYDATASDITITANTTDTRYGFVAINDVTTGSETSNAETLRTQTQIIPVNNRADIDINITVTAEDGTTNTYILHLSRTKSSNSYLAQLSLTETALNELFTPRTTEYTSSIEGGYDSVTLKARPSVPYSNIISVKLNNREIEYTADPVNKSIEVVVSGLNFPTTQNPTNKIQVVVQSESGDERTYTIDLTRELYTIATLEGLGVSGYTFDEEFTNETYSYHVTNQVVPYATTQVEVVGALSNSYSTIKIYDGNGAEVTPVMDGIRFTATLPVHTGDNTLNVKVYAHNTDERYAKTYSIDIKRDFNTNCSINSVLVTGSSNTPTLNPGDGKWYVIVPNSKTELTPNDVVVVRSDPNATVTKSPTMELSTKNDNEYTFTVTAEDGVTSREYTLVVTRTKSRLNALNSVEIYASNNGVDYIYQDRCVPVNNECDVSVSTDTTNFYFITSISDEATISPVDETKYSMPAGQSNLTMPLAVTAEDSTVANYSINVNRTQSSNSRLSNIKLNGVDLEGFDPATLQYNIEYDHSVADVLVEATVEDVGKATILTDLSNPFALNYGSGNQIAIEVQAENPDATRTYYLNITRKYNDDATLLNILVDDTPVASFTPNNTTYAANDINYENTTVNITPVLSDTEFETYTIANIDPVTSEVIYNADSSNNVTLNTGDNVIQITTTAHDGTTKKYYKIYIRRKKNSNINITKVTVAGVEATKESDTVYTVTVPNDVYEANQENTIFEFADGILETDSKPTYEVTTKTLYTSVVSNPVTVVVTAEDGETDEVITVNVERTKSNRASLHELTLTSGSALGTFSPLFVADDESADTITYEVSVPKNNDFFTVAYVISDRENITDERAVVSCELNDTPVDCSDTMAINAMSGLATVKVIVTSEDTTVTRTYVINLSRVKSSDAEVGNLILTEKDSGNDIPYTVRNDVYSATVAANVNDINISIVPNSPYAMVDEITFNGSGVSFTESVDHTTYNARIENLSYDYNNGINTIVVTIIAEDGSRKFHTINVTRTFNDDTTLKSFVVDGEEEISKFENTAARLYEYRYINVEYNKTYLDIIPEVTDSYASYQISGGESIVSNGSVNKVNLKTGSNTIVTVVTAQDGSSGYYYFYVTRKKNSDVSFKSVSISDNTASCNLSTRICTVVVPNETIEVNNDNTKVVFNDLATSYDTYATYTVQPTPLPEGIVTNVLMTVTAEDGTIADYIIKVTRASSDVSTADNIIVATDVGTNGSFTPAFDKNTNDYIVALVSNAEEFTISVNKTNENAIVTGDGTYSFATNDPDGDEKIIIPIHITSQSGNTETTYNLTIVRGLNTIATLGGLKVYSDSEKTTSYDLTPTFLPDSVTSVDYSTNVAGDVTSVYLDTTVTASSRATISSIRVNGEQLPIGEKINSYQGDINLISNYANLVLITVVSEDTFSSTVYRLTINRAANIDASLSSLKVEGIEYIDENEIAYLDTMYQDDDGNYRVDGIVIPNSKSTINVSAIKSDPNSSFNTKLKIQNGSESTVNLGDIVIPVGTNLITITVTAQDGTTTEKYIIEVTREPSTESRASYVMFYDQLFTIQDDVNDYYYVVTNNSLTEIKDSDVTVTTRSNGATVNKTPNVQIITSVNDPTDITYYASEYRFTVTAEDGVNTSEYVFYIHKDFSSNANLRTVNLSKGAISPLFNSSVAAYTITLPYGTSTFEIEGVPEEATTTVVGNGVYNYEDGLVIQLKTTAEDGRTSQNYKFAVTMAESTDAYLNALSVVSYSFEETFKKTLFNYTLEDIDYGTTQLAVAYSKSNSGATVVCDIDGVVEPCEQMNVPQVVGSHRISVLVTAEDSVTQKPYTIDFNVVPSSNAYLLDLTAEDADGNSLQFGFSRAITSGYAITVPYTTEEVTFEATATSEYATLNISTTNSNGSSSEDINYYQYAYTFENLVVGQNIIYVKVIPQDPNSTSRTYSVIINRAKREASKVTTLSSLEILDKSSNPYTLDPVFTIEQDTYDIGTIDFLTDSATVNVTTTDPNASVLYLVNGIVQSSKNINIPITTGNGYIQIYVIAEDGETIGTYTINYNKQASNNWKLEDLYISNQSFTFNPDNQDQTFTYPFEISSSVISFKPQVKGTSIKIGTQRYNTPNESLQTYTVPSLVIGDNEIMIECTAEDGTVGYYKILLVREASTELITSYEYGHKITTPTTGVGYILDVLNGTKASELKDQLDNNNSYIKIYDALDNDEIPEGDPLGTGMIAKLIIDRNEADRKIIVVPGDTNGDTEVDIFDLLLMVDHILENQSLEGAYFYAGEIANEDDEIDIYDLLSVVDIILSN